MADEIRVVSSLQIRSGTNFFQIQPTSFNEDLTGLYKGPVPGAFTAGVGGTDVDFSQLLTPGWCVIQNQDDTNFVTWGIWDSDHSRFHPLGEILPGHYAMFRS